MLLVVSYTCRASDKSVYVYSFNVPPDQLKEAYDLLDKEDLRKSMKLLDLLHHGDL